MIQFRILAIAHHIRRHIRYLKALPHNIPTKQLPMHILILLMSINHLLHFILAQLRRLSIPHFPRNQKIMQHAHLIHRRHMPLQRQLAFPFPALLVRLAQLKSKIEQRVAGVLEIRDLGDGHGLQLALLPTSEQEHRAHFYVFRVVKHIEPHLHCALASVRLTGVGDVALDEDVLVNRGDGAKYIDAVDAHRHQVVVQLVSLPHPSPFPDSGNQYDDNKYVHTRSP